MKQISSCSTKDVNRRSMSRRTSRSLPLDVLNHKEERALPLLPEVATQSTSSLLLESKYRLVLSTRGNGDAE